MIDLHTHILPGVDDGAPDLETSVLMAAVAAESGVTHLVATPHSNQRGAFENYASQALQVRFDCLCAAVREAGIPLELSLGMEIFGTGDVPKLLREGRLLTINGGRYLLIEFGFHEDPLRIERLLDELLAAGYWPVVAHPERYFCVQDTPELLYEFREMGAVLQINKGSVFGRFGEEAERTARFLLENRLAGCVASDAHGADYRTTDMRPVRQFLEERYGEAYAQLLVKVNPRRILEDRQIFYEPSPERKRKRRWFL
mgnify:CR=1 FL=1